MFGHLLMSDRKFYNPMPWLHSYKDETGRPTNVLIQQDAQEFFNMLCDRLEGRLKGSSQEKLLQVGFGLVPVGCCRSLLSPPPGIHRPHC